MNHSPSHTPPRRIYHLAVLGSHDYADLVATYHREPRPFILKRLFETFRGDFEAASTVVAPKEWIYLAWQRPCAIHELSDPAFDPRLGLGERSHKPVDLVPDGLTADEVEDFRQTMPEALRTIDADVAKAVWCILSVVRQLCRTNDVIDEERWWEPLWIAEHLPDFPVWIAQSQSGNESSAMSDPNLDIPI